MAKANTCKAQCSFSNKSSASTYIDLDWSSIMNSTFFEKPFVDSLVKFMRESFSVIDKIHQESGKANAVMSEQERQRKMQELMTRIAEKEKELSQLEAERRGMLSNYDPSASSNSGGSGFSPPQMGVRSLPIENSQARAATYQSSIYDCDDECEGDCNDTSGSYSRYTGSARSAGYTRGAGYMPSMSSPIRPGARPPSFNTSGYDSSCMQDCTEPCSTMDSTMARWHKQLRVNPYQ